MSCGAARSATSRRTRASPACWTAAPPCRTSSPGAASTPSSSGSRSCASRWRSSPTSATWRATRVPRTSSARTVDTPPTARPAPSPPGWASVRAASTIRSACCPGASAGASSWPRILFAGSDVLCLDEPTNHLDVDAKEWLMGFLRGYRGALLVISHDLELLDEAITRGAPPRSARRGRRRPPRRVQGHVHAVPRGPGRGRGAPHQGGGPPSQGDRPPATLRRSLRRQGHQGGGRPQHGEADRPVRGRQGRGDPRRQGAARQVPAAPDARPHGGGGRRDDQVVQRARRCSATSPSTSGGASACSCSASTAPARRACCGSSPARSDADRGTVTWGHNVTVGYYAQEHDNLRRDESLLDNIRREMPPDLVLTETQLRGFLGMFGLSGARRSSRTPARCPAARRRSWRWPC